jgi:hypothetical protein
MARQNPIVALIVPMYDPSLKPDQGLPGGQGGRPDHTLPGDLPHPEHPIYYPLPPGAPVDPDYGIDINAPYPDQGLPGSQPKPDQSLPEGQPHPDQGLPGDQPKPSHPIVLPPDSGGWEPVYIWGPTDPRPGTGLPGSQPKPDQGLPAFPSHPIELPPDVEAPPELGISGTIKFKAIWTPANGWQTIGVIIPSTDGSGKPVPTPSSKAKK